MNDPKEAAIQAALAASQRAFGARDMQGAVSALADAFALDPFDTPALQLAYSMLPQVPNLVQMTAPQKGTPRKIVAIHAMALGLSHQFSPAMEILFNLGAQDPKTPYLMWADNWTSTHPAALLLDLGKVGPAISRFADKFEDAIEKTSPWYETLDAGINVLKRVSDAFVDNRALKTVYVKLLRRAQRYDEALAIAGQLKAKDPYFGNLMTAWTYRDMGRPHDAIAAFKAGYAVQPDAGVLLDIGDLHFNHGEFEQACDTYRQVQPGESYDWAYASYWAAYHLSARDAQSLSTLTTLLEKSPRARELHALIHAYAEVQPGPRDLTAGIARDALGYLKESPGNPNEPAKLDVNISSIESPSVYVAFDLACRMTRGHAKLNVVPEKEAKPDPRLPLMTAIGRGADLVYQQFPIWVYEGARPKVNAPPPPAGVAEAVAAIANTPFDWAGWQAAAAQAAAGLRGQMTGLVCALVHPPVPADPSADPIDWLWHYQLAGALVITKLDGGWSASERRGGLLAMVHGPIDWLISAALPCLGLVYAECEEARGELDQIFAALRQRIPDIGYACYRAPLEAVAMRLPGIDEKTRREAWTRLVKATQKPYLG